MRTVLKSEVETCDRCKHTGAPDERVLHSCVVVYDDPEPEHGVGQGWQLCAKCFGQLAAWLKNPLHATMVVALLLVACGGAGATTENPAHEPLPYHCQVFIATARVCIAQREPSERAELNATLQSTIDMWRVQQRDGVTLEALDHACEQSTGWGSDLAYCPEE